MNQLDQNLSCPAISDSVASWTVATRLLCPWGSPRKHTGVGCHAHLQEVFLIQRSNPGFLHCRQRFYCLSHQGSPPHYTRMHVCISTLFLDPFPILSLQNIEQSSLRSTVGTCWLSIYNLYIVVCICWSQIPIFIPLSSYPLVTMSVFYTCDSIILSLNLASLLSVSQMLHFRMQICSFYINIFPRLEGGPSSGWWTIGMSLRSWLHF